MIGKEIFGGTGMNVLNPAVNPIVLPTMAVVQMVMNDVILHTIASGGGWGDPLERDPELVRRDAWDEKISLHHAREVYGVIIDPHTYEVDMESTTAFRVEYK